MPPALAGSAADRSKPISSRVRRPRRLLMKSNWLQADPIRSRRSTSPKARSLGLRKTVSTLGKKSAECNLFSSWARMLALSLADGHARRRNWANTFAARCSARLRSLARASRRFGQPRQSEALRTSFLPSGSGSSSRLGAQRTSGAAASCRWQCRSGILSLFGRYEFSSGETPLLLSAI